MNDSNSLRCASSGSYAPQEIKILWIPPPTTEQSIEQILEIKTSKNIPNASVWHTLLDANDVQSFCENNESHIRAIETENEGKGGSVGIHRILCDVTKTWKGGYDCRYSDRKSFSPFFYCFWQTMNLIG